LLEGKQIFIFSKTIFSNLALISKIIILFLFFTSYSCNNDKFEPPKTNLQLSDSIPDQESFNTSVTFSDSGFVKAVLKASWIRVYSKSNITLVDSGAVVDFFKKGVYASTLTALRGKIYDITKDVEVYENVKLVSPDGSLLTTNKLLWVNKTQRIKTDDFVHIKTPKEDIQGYGFESDQSLTNYVIYKVSGNVQK
jgi:LPS export ABC transporter protein LptC